MRNKQNTSWGPVAEWYSSYLESTDDSYQKQVILPNLVRVLNIKGGERLIDIACGQGYFTRQFAEAGASVVGADISKELIEEAKKLSPNIEYHVAPAHELRFAESKTFDTATIVLAVQNIENIADAFKEAGRVLKQNGRLILVLMHPAFRIPQSSSWQWDDEENIQYRRIDTYLSQQSSELIVHPGSENSPKTISHHRSLQDFSKALFRSGFAITRLEEWISHKKSEKGPRQEAEDKARKEFPLFLMIEATKIADPAL